MAQEKYILLNVSAGIMEEKGRDPMPYASVEVANCKAVDNSRDGRTSYGSPVVKLNLIDEETGKPNIPLARRLAAANLYGQAVNFHGTFGLAKKKGVEQVTFIIMDADTETKPAAVKAAS